MMKRIDFMIRCLPLGIFLMFLAVLSSFAQGEGKQENRFLIILDTSAPMEKKAPAMQKAVGELVTTGMHGLIRDGDTLGIWTFNEKLSTEFPMQVWSDAGKQGIFDTTLGYVRILKYGKKSRFDRMLPSMYSILKSSQTLTVVLVTDGTEQMQGSRFDKEINNLHKEFQKTLSEAGLPFVTVLASRDGEIFDYAVNSAIGPIRVPDAVDPTNRVVAVPVKVFTNSATAQPTKKREPRHVVIGPAKTNAVAEVKPTELETNASVTPGVATPAPVETNPAAVVVPTPAAVANPPAVATNAPAVTTPAPVVVTNPAPAPQPAVVTPAPKPEVHPAVENAKPVDAASKPPEVVKASEPQKSFAAPETNRAAGVVAGPQPLQAPALGGSSKLLLMVSMGFLVLGVLMICFIIWYLRRSRKRPSIISQSIKRTGDVPER